MNLLFYLIYTKRERVISMWSILFKVILFIFIVISPILISILVHFLYFYFVKNMRFKEGDYHYVGYGSILKRIVIDFPRQFVLDAFNRDPDNFREYGVHIIAGKQGSGKSITLTYMLLRYQQMYPKLKIKTNYYYEFENAHIGHWKDVVNGTNGIYGEIDVLDEIQNWFNSLQSKDFPVEMLTEITQQRKQTKMIIGTSQVFIIDSECIFSYVSKSISVYIFIVSIIFLLPFQNIIPIYGTLGGCY